MVGLLMRKMLRDIRRSLSSYLVAGIIVATGFAGYSVLSNAANQLEASKDFFFRSTSFCDGFAEVQLAPTSATRELEKIDGIARAQGRLVQTVRVIGSEKERELRLISIVPDGLNHPLLSQGMLPAAGERQIVLGDGFCKANGLSPGDSIPLLVLGREARFTITGSGLSPENIYLLKNITEMLPTPETYDAGFLEYETMARLLGREGRANSFVFTLENGVTFESVKEEIEDVLKPYGCYRVYENSDELSVSMLETEIEQLTRMTGVIPLLFLFIAAIILSISLHRLIEQQRTQIGTLMALGLSGRAVALHYTCYGAAVGLFGGLTGGIYGSLAAKPMADFYRVYFSLPASPIPASPRYVIIGTLTATVFCAVISGFAVQASSHLIPAEALRPAPPKKARRLFLEWIPGFLSLFTVPGVLALRGLARNPRRSLLSLFGVACAYMITATLVSMSSMFDIFLFDSLEKNQQQDVTVAFSSPMPAADALRAVRSDEILVREGIVEIPVKLRGREGELDGMVQGMSRYAELYRLYDEDDRRVYVQPNGIVLSVHMAGQLGVEIGDTIEIEVMYPETRVSRVAVTGIIAQYLGSNAYMSLEGVGRISEYRSVYTSLLLKAADGARDSLLHRLDGATAVATVQSKQQRIDQYRGAMGNISGVMGIMCAMGVLVGFAVIYVSSLISFEELKRELAVMRMLGLSDRECMQTISLGQWLLAFGSLLPGVPMTIGVSRLISKSMSLELFSIPDFVDGKALALSVVLLFIAVLWSNHAVYRKLQKTTPVELLRERE